MDCFKEISRSCKVTDAIEPEQKVSSRIFKPRLDDDNENAIRKAHFADNNVRTAKYTLLTFLPLNLYEQSVVSLIPRLSPSTPETTVLGYLLVVGVSMVKDAFEDYQRYVSDHAANQALVSVLRNNEFVRIPSRKIRVGNVVKIFENDICPADIAILSTSNHEDRTCLIETSNLDGESSLKRLSSVEAFVGFANEVNEMTKALKGTFTVEAPNDGLYHFVGKFSFDGPIDLPRISEHPLKVENMCLAGARLKKTEWAMGVVVYAGMDSKIQMNNRVKSWKVSRVDKAMNRFVACLLVSHIIICILLSVGSVISFESSSTFWYLDASESSKAEQLLNFFTFFVLLNTLVPLALGICLEIANFSQALFMALDEEMKTNKVPMRVLASNLNAELGQVEHVFCDKTGTLTQNKMCLARCSVGGSQFLRPLDGELGDLIKSSGLTSLTRETCYDYLRLLALCNDVIPRQAEGALGFAYEGSSPDDVALVQGAACNNVVLQVRRAKSIVLAENDKIVEYEILEQFPFTPQSKRMSVLIRSQDKKLILLVKGADQVMMPLFAPTSISEQTMLDAKSFATQGLRVMLTGQRLIDDEEYARYRTESMNASLDFQNQDQTLSSARAILECNITYLGATGVEDKLQDEVADTVQYLLGAVSAVWMITGDQLETAIIIARSAKLLSEGMSVLTLDGNPTEDYLRLVKDKVDTTISVGEENSSLNMCVAINGNILSWLLNDGQDVFIQICTRFKVVVCARCAPAHKADVVRFVAEKLGKVTLAVGDGGNDVPMLLTANIGVGIMGNEGLQAARSSDFAIGEFRLMKRLIGVHGRYNNMRTATIVKYILYKNCCFCAPQIFFSCFCSFSGQNFQHNWIILWYNILFTGLPVLILATFDVDINEESIFSHPYLYNNADQKQHLSITALASGQGNGLWQAAVLTFGTLFAMSNICQNGFAEVGSWASLDSNSLLVSEATVIVVSVDIALRTNFWTGWNVLSIALSVLLFYLVLQVINLSLCPDERQAVSGCGITDAVVLGDARSWLVMLLLLLVAVIPALVGQALLLQVWPRSWQVHQEAWIRDQQQPVHHASPDEAPPASTGILGVGLADISRPEMTG